MCLNRILGSLVEVVCTTSEFKIGTKYPSSTFILVIIYLILSPKVRFSTTYLILLYILDQIIEKSSKKYLQSVRLMFGSRRVI